MKFELPVYITIVMRNAVIAILAMKILAIKIVVKLIVVKMIAVKMTVNMNNN